MRQRTKHLPFFLRQNPNWWKSAERITDRNGFISKSVLTVESLLTWRHTCNGYWHNLLLYTHSWSQRWFQHVRCWWINFLIFWKKSSRVLISQDSGLCWILLRSLCGLCVDCGLWTVDCGLKFSGNFILEKLNSSYNPMYTRKCFLVLDSCTSTYGNITWNF